jgi:hypothetical protein
MTLNELIEALQDIALEDELNGERDVRLATQPNYPLQSTVRGVCTSREAHDDPDDPDDDPDDCIYIVEGFQIRERPYAPNGAFEVI